MQHKLVLFLLISMVTFQTIAQKNIKGFYIGHSLSDQIPDMVKSLAEDHAEATFDWAYQGIPGAPLRWQWQRKNENDYAPNPPYYYGFYNPEGGLPSGQYDVLVLTEAVPRYDQLIEETYAYSDSFYVYANRYNNGIKIYLYEDWHCIKSGTPTQCDYDVDSNPWRQRLTDDLPMWESVVDTLNQRFPSDNPVCLIPAAQGLAQVYDSIYSGVMPGLNKIEDLFSDDIHLNDVGKYFVACIHFSTLFETSPIGLTNQLKVWWGGDFDAPSPALALKFQEIAWEIATNYPRSCVSPISNVIAEPKLSKTNIYPNPVLNTLYIKGNTESMYHIYNNVGKKVLTSQNVEIDVSSLTSGIYYIRSNEGTLKFIKI